MKTLPARFQAHLDEGTTTLAWCWRLQRRDGAVFGFTDHDRALAFAGTNFEPETGFAASEIRSLGDLSVDAQDVQGALRSDRITETDIADGLWDNAAVEVWLVNWQAISQRVLMRRGSIGEIRRGRHAFTAEVRALAHLLNQPVGRTFQYFCDATLGDARCGVNLTGPLYRGTGAVTASIGDRRLTVATGLGAFASGWFDFGVVEWTSGPNAWRRAEVASHTRPHPRTLEAARLGAKVVPISPGYLSVVQSRAREYCRNTGASLIPFGAEIPGAVEAIAAAARLAGFDPEEVWCAAGSGVLARGLAAAWPKARRHVVQIGRDLTPREVAGATIHAHPRKFSDRAALGAPFPADPHYDAKAWELCLAKRGPGRVLFWNVAPLARG